MTSRRAVLAGACLACSVVSNAAPVAAQTSPSERFQIGIGAGWVAGASLGEQSADLRTAGTSGQLSLFDSATDFTSTGLLEARLGFAVSGRVNVEARAALAHPETRTFLSNDAENAAPATVAVAVDQYTFDGGVLIRVPEWRFFDVLPFAAAGAGYVRQVHDGNMLVENGQIYYAGGGVLRALVSLPRGFVRALSARADVRLNVLAGGLDEDARRHMSASGSLVLTF